MQAMLGHWIELGHFMIEAVLILALALLVAWLVVPALKIIRWLLAFLLVLLLVTFALPSLLLYLS